MNASGVRVDAFVFDWGGTFTSWHDIDPEAQLYAYAENWAQVNARDDVHGAQSFGMQGMWIPHSQLPVAQVPDCEVVPKEVAEQLIDVDRLIGELNSITPTEKI